jgi:hypothetical protein
MLELLPSTPAFLTVDPACRHLGVSRTRLYEHLAKLDPKIIVQLGGRTVVDVQRAVALIQSLPKGPRKPQPRGAKGGARPKPTLPEPRGDGRLHD